MKIVYASTQEQEQKVTELMDYMYSDIFPYYYQDEEISEFKDMNILRASSCEFSSFGTLKDSYRVLTSLQTIISILELRIFKKECGDYEEIFNRNRKILEEYEICFPFFYDQFQAKEIVSCSVYKRADNQLLI